MINIRNITPIRRLTPTNNPSGKNWSEHKTDLKEDFNKRCGYCNSMDVFRHTYFEVDHFIPKSLFEISGNISYCQYDNLVYSCKFCNNKKSYKWPTQDENVPNNGNIGFVDPCSDSYDEHLYRTTDGSILWKTALGEYMVTTAFKFDERDYSIRLLHEIGEVLDVLRKLKGKLSVMSAGSEQYNNCYKQVAELSMDFVDYFELLTQYYDDISNRNT